MVTINMLILKHLKYENSRSVIDIVLDKEMSVIDGIFTTDLEHQFQKVTGEKNTYRLESTPGDLMVLDLMKCMRKRQWMLMTSHSFMHLSLDKTMESHFYFERILTPNSSSSSSATGANPSVSELLSSYRTRPLNENEFVLEEEKTSYINSRISSHFGTTNSKLPGFTGMSSGGNNASSSSKSKEDPSAKPMPSPEVMAFILDKSATQSGPYGFAKRQTLLTAQHPRLKREANGSPPRSLHTQSLDEGSFRHLLNDQQSTQFKISPRPVSNNPPSPQLSPASKPNGIAAERPFFPAPKVTPAVVQTPAPTQTTYSKPVVYSSPHQVSQVESTPLRAPVVLASSNPVVAEYHIPPKQQQQSPVSSIPQQQESMKQSPRYEMASIDIDRKPAITPIAMEAKIVPSFQKEPEKVKEKERQPSITATTQPTLLQQIGSRAAETSEEVKADSRPTSQQQLQSSPSQQYQEVNEPKVVHEVVKPVVVVEAAPTKNEEEVHSKPPEVEVEKTVVAPSDSAPSTNTVTTAHEDVVVPTTTAPSNQLQQQPSESTQDVVVSPLVMAGTEATPSSQNTAAKTQTSSLLSKYQVKKRPSVLTTKADESEGEEKSQHVSSATVDDKATTAAVSTNAASSLLNKYNVKKRPSVLSKPDDEPNKHETSHTAEPSHTTAESKSLSVLFNKNETPEDTNASENKISNNPDIITIPPITSKPFQNTIKPSEVQHVAPVSSNATTSSSSVLPSTASAASSQHPPSTAPPAVVVTPPVSAPVTNTPVVAAVVPIAATPVAAPAVVVPITSSHIAPPSSQQPVIDTTSKPILAAAIANPAVVLPTPPVPATTTTSSSVPAPSSISATTTVPPSASIAPTLATPAKSALVQPNVTPVKIEVAEPEPEVITAKKVSSGSKLLSKYFQPRKKAEEPTPVKPAPVVATPATPAPAPAPIAVVAATPAQTTKPTTAEVPKSVPASSSHDVHQTPAKDLHAQHDSTNTSRAELPSHVSTPSTTTTHIAKDETTPKSSQPAVVQTPASKISTQAYPSTTPRSPSDDESDANAEPNTPLANNNNNVDNDNSEGNDGTSAEVNGEGGIESADGFEVNYKEKPEMVRSISHLLEAPVAKPSTGEVLDPNHENNKTNHYSKLGSAFVTKNVMGRLGGRTGAGRGRGRGL